MPNTALKVVEAETVVLLPVGQCHRSPQQPRRRGADDKMDADFVASIREKGVLQPIVVRKRKAGGWEIVFGHRRHAGSILAEREAIPAIVRDMTDDDVFEAQLIENVHRQEMHPLDECDGFKRMVDHGKTAQYIADKIGRPLTYVAQRLKLVDLGKEGRAKLDKDEISLGVAMLIARIPAPLQAEALGTLWRDSSVKDAQRQLGERYLLRLDQAPFDIADAKLVEKAGACTVCPKRTGQQRELFPDAARSDMCIDPVCYRGKLDAVWQIRKKEAAAGGLAVLEGKAADKAFGYGSGYKKLDEEVWAGTGHKKVRALFGKQLPSVTLARDDKTGAIHEMVKEAEVAKRLPKDRSLRYGNEGDRDWRKRKEKDQLQAAAVEIAVSQAVEKIKKVPGPALLQLLTASLISRAYDDAEKTIRRRGIARDKKTRTGFEGLEAYLATLKKPVDVAGLGFELAIRAFAPSRNWDGDSGWAQAMKLTGVNFAAIHKKLVAEAAAKKKAKGKKAKPAK